MLLIGTGLLLLTGARLTVYNQNPVIPRIHKLMIHSGLTIGKNHGTAGAHGQNYRHFIVQVRDGGRDPMLADILGFDGYPPNARSS
jgi:hypothetical protein